MINNLISNYTIKSHIGSGGMADLYLGENQLGKQATLKILKKELSSNIQIKDRFIKEARIIASIEHPNIRQVYDIDEYEGQPVIIMEYLDGVTLKEKVDKEGAVPSETLKLYYEKCLSALEYTHSKGIIHRDIKPSNIFITKSNEVKILDYGIAKSKEGSSHTMTGQMLGTVMYMSPEQITDPKRVTASTDLYSLGVTMYHALTGNAPYDNTESQYKIQTKIINEGLDFDSLKNNYWKLEIIKLTTNKNGSISKHIISNMGSIDKTIITNEQRQNFIVENSKNTKIDRHKEVTQIGELDVSFEIENKNKEPRILFLMVNKKNKPSSMTIKKGDSINVSWILSFSDGIMIDSNILENISSYNLSIERDKTIAFVPFKYIDSELIRGNPHNVTFHIEMPSLPIFNCLIPFIVFFLLLFLYLSFL